MYNKIYKENLIHFQKKSSDGNKMQEIIENDQVKNSEECEIATELLRLDPTQHLTKEKISELQSLAKQRSDLEDKLILEEARLQEEKKESFYLLTDKIAEYEASLKTMMNEPEIKMYPNFSEYLKFSHEPDVEVLKKDDKFKVEYRCGETYSSTFNFIYDSMILTYNKKGVKVNLYGRTPEVEGLGISYKQIQPIALSTVTTPLVCYLATKSADTTIAGFIGGFVGGLVLGVFSGFHPKRFMLKDLPQYDEPKFQSHILEEVFKMPKYLSLAMEKNLNFRKEDLTKKESEVKDENKYHGLIKSLEA